MPLKPSLSFLLVDDMNTTTQILKENLKKLGFTGDIHIANNGTEAQEILIEKYENLNPIEFVISDWNMPEITGIDLLHFVRKDKRFKELPFILVTSENDLDHVEMAITEKVSDFIIKPWNSNTLSKKLIKVWEKHHPN